MLLTLSALVALVAAYCLVWPDYVWVGNVFDRTRLTRRQARLSGVLGLIVAVGLAVASQL